MASDPKVDAYIAAAAPFARPILTHLRALVHDTVPDLEEGLKWGMPHFIYKGKNLASMAAFKAHAAFSIYGEAAANAEREVQKGMGHFGKITAIADLPGENLLRSRIVAGKERIDTQGTALKKKPAAIRQAKPDSPIPPEFAAALAGNPAAKATLEGFAPSHRREYVEWIAEAKRPETRAKRIAQAIEWLAEGKKRNWKYENC
jgi:uncharacterized protein YdeI (YjbR/CyaY-like superfamily)